MTNNNHSRQLVILTLCPAIAEYHLDDHACNSLRGAVAIVDNNDCPYCSGTPLFATIYTGHGNNIPVIAPKELIV